MNKINWKALLPHLIAIGIFLAVALIYCQPVLEGKVLVSNDDTQFQGAAHEAINSRKAGEEALWTNSMFGGMPTYLISYYPQQNLIGRIARAVLHVLPLPANYLFWAMLCFYCMLITFKFKPYASIAGALAFGLASYNVVIIGTGHYAKMIAIGFFPLIIAGINLVFQKKYVWGGILVGIATAINLVANHVQMTYYYFVFFISFYMLYLVIDMIIKKEVSHAVKSSVIVGVMLVLGILTNSNRFLPVNEYTPYSTRGASELVKNLEDNEKTGGLPRSYIVSYSFGRGDIMSLLIPNYKGPRNGQLLTNPIAKEVIPKKDVQLIGGTEGLLYQQNQEIVDQYWGGQDSAGGGFYLSTIIFALFLLAFFFVKHPIRWVVIPAFFITLFLSWGKNYMSFTNFFIDHFPMYSKFRAVNSIIIVIEFVVPLLASFLIATMVNEKDWMNKTWMGKLRNKTALLGGMGIIALIVGMMYITPTAFQSFFKPATYIAQYKEEITEDELITRKLTEAGAQQEQIDTVLSDIVAARIAIFKADAARTIAYLVLAGILLAIWGYAKVDPRILAGVLALLVLVDVWSHDKRYLNEKNFMEKGKAKNEFAETIADKSILQDKSLDYRVLNLSVSTFSDATTSYHHKSLGGYHGAKMKRYQELVEHYIYKDINIIVSSGATTLQQFDSVMVKTQILNMLNTKYIIFDDKSPALPNSRAFGPAWIVRGAVEAANADEELDKLRETDLKNALVYDVRFADLVKTKKNGSVDSAASIRLTKYDPNHLEYEFNSANDEWVVFSEIYYPKGWNAFIDGNPVGHFRANYVLRGMMIPAGTHKIQFDFEPVSVKKGETFSLIGSIMLLLALLGGILWEFRKRKQVIAKS